jgi:hypothetical protein
MAILCIARTKYADVVVLSLRFAGAMMARVDIGIPFKRPLAAPSPLNEEQGSVRSEIGNKWSQMLTRGKNLSHTLMAARSTGGRPKIFSLTF